MYLLRVMRQKMEMLSHTYLSLGSTIYNTKLPLHCALSSSAIDSSSFCTRTWCRKKLFLIGLFDVFNLIALEARDTM